jgi:hypothetical protein
MRGRYPWKTGLGCLAVVLVALVASFSRADGGAADADGAVRFGICPANISTVIITKEGDGEGPVRLAITLNSDGSKQLQSLSEEHLGEVVEMVFDGAVLVRAPLSARITSGKVLSRRWSSERAAEEFAKLLGNNTLEVPCGLIKE